ncbi:MAG: hypothetical protein MN733_37215, partial [Nitrososphaera sp.]|nr:hypothetical protein [Nitrososphaera sp.]
WNFVVRHSLEGVEPSYWAPLIIEAFGAKGDEAGRGIGQKLKNTKWLPLKLGRGIAPDSVILLEGLQDDLHRLLDPEKDGIAGIATLPSWIVQHKGFKTLRNYFPRIPQALQYLGEWLKEKPDWRLGLSESFTSLTLDELLPQIMHCQNLPAAELIVKLRAAESITDTLLQSDIFPAVFRRFDYTQGGIEKIQTILQSLQDHKTRIAFDIYLNQAYKDEILKPILPNLMLVNQQGQWRPARQLIWPSSNLDTSTQLCEAQAKIIRTLHPGFESEQQRTDRTGPPLDEQSHQLPEPPDFDAEIGKLVRYLQPFRNGNIGPNLPAALVAVLGGFPTMQRLLEELLRESLQQDVETFLAFLLGEQSTRLEEYIFPARFLIDIVQGEQTEATTITGENIMVELTNEINNLLVGDPADLWRTYYYKNVYCHRVRLRSINNPDDLIEPVTVFADTIGTILLKVHCNQVPEIYPSGLKEALA